MIVSQVDNKDGVACAQLLKFLQSGEWKMTGADADVLNAVKLWVRGLAGQMASQLQDKKPDTQMRIKSAGPLAPSPSPPTRPSPGPKKSGKKTK